MDQEDKREEQKIRKKNRNRELNKLQKILKVKFKDKSLLNRALTHRSFVNEIKADLRDNERLEYLGDSVLAVVINEYLFKRYEEYLEGDLAKIKSAVVSEVTLAKIASDVNIGSFILMGKGEERSGGRIRASILANTLEALIGAIYLDAGLKVSKRFILSLFKKDVERIDKLSYLRDPKTTLQEFVQGKYKQRPVYEVIEETGPDHKKEFTVKLCVNGKEITTGTGSSKRKAEMDAAKKVLQEIQKGVSPI
ncbi:MAG: ribonuclease III [Spirochaetes bacterium]|jgi:ribonuclease-3|nr:ribonuclease III [Spirochaetota bacterium]